MITNVYSYFGILLAMENVNKVAMWMSNRLTTSTVKDIRSLQVKLQTSRYWEITPAVWIFLHGWLTKFVREKNGCHLVKREQNLLWTYSENATVCVEWGRAGWSYSSYRRAVHCYANVLLVTFNSQRFFHTSALPAKLHRKQLQKITVKDDTALIKSHCRGSLFSVYR